MKLVIAGANGFLGNALALHFKSLGHEVVELVRRQVESSDYRAVVWDGAVLGSRVEELDGAEVLINLAAPEPMPNREFMRCLRRGMKIPVGLPIPRWLVSWGARLLRTECELVLKSRWVVPERLQQHGFRFRWPRLEAALADLGRPQSAGPGPSPGKNLPQPNDSFCGSRQMN